MLLKIGEKWLLPGGYIFRDESVDDAANRILKERTSLEDPHLKFLSISGDRNRNFRDEFKQFALSLNIPWRKDYWLNDRFVTLCYYSLVDIEITHPIPGLFHEKAEWFSFEELPEIWMDHHSILMSARQRLMEDIRREPITYNLLSEHFTMPQLHQLHQAILQQDIDRSRLQKKMLSSGFFERLPQLKKDSPGRSPYLYRLKI